MLQSRFAGHAAMFLFSALIAGSYSLGAKAAAVMDPVVLTTMRFVIAGSLLTGLALSLHRFDRAWLKAPWRYAAMGMSMALYFVLMFVALKTTSPVNTSAVFTLAPVFASIFGYVLLRQVISRWTAAALAIGAAGALWVIFDGSLLALLSLDMGYGEAIFILGTISHALYAALIPFLNRGEPTVVFTAGMLIAGSAILIVIAGPSFPEANVFALSAEIWGIILYLAIATTALTFFLVQFAAQRLPASKVMAYTYIVPSWVAIWEIVQGNPAPAAIVFWGVGLTVVALLMLLKQ